MENTKANCSNYTSNFLLNMAKLAAPLIPNPNCTGPRRRGGCGLVRNPMFPDHEFVIIDASTGAVNVYDVYVSVINGDNVDSISSAQYQNVAYEFKIVNDLFNDLQKEITWTESNGTFYNEHGVELSAYIVQSASSSSQKVNSKGFRILTESETLTDVCPTAISYSNDNLCTSFINNLIVDHYAENPTGAWQNFWNRLTGAQSQLMMVGAGASFEAQGTTIPTVFRRFDSSVLVLDVDGTTDPNVPPSIKLNADKSKTANQSTFLQASQFVDSGVGTYLSGLEVLSLADSFHTECSNSLEQVGFLKTYFVQEFQRPDGSSYVSITQIDSQGIFQFVSTCTGDIFVLM